MLNALALLTLMIVVIPDPRYAAGVGLLWVFVALVAPKRGR